MLMQVVRVKKKKRIKRCVPVSARKSSIKGIDTSKETFLYLRIFLKEK